VLVFFFFFFGFWGGLGGFFGGFFLLCFLVFFGGVFVPTVPSPSSAISSSVFDHVKLAYNKTGRFFFITLP